MTQEDLNRALAQCESFTEYVLVKIAGFRPPWTFLTVVFVLALAMVAGRWIL